MFWDLTHAFLSECCHNMFIFVRGFEEVMGSSGGEIDRSVWHQLFMQFSTKSTCCVFQMKPTIMLHSWDYKILSLIMIFIAHRSHRECTFTTDFESWSMVDINLMQTHVYCEEDINNIK